MPADIPDSVRVLVTGSRRAVASARMKVDSALRDLLGDEPVTIIHGDAPGIDSIADKVAERYGFNVYRFPAEWDWYAAHGVREQAGRERNQEMLDTMQPDLVLAFPGKRSIGTWDMVRRAHDAGIPVRVMTNVPDVRVD